MLFGLKKLIGFWLMPLPFCFAAMIVGLLLQFSKRKARAGRVVVVAAIVALMLFSNKFVSKWLIGGLETKYPAMPVFAAGAALPPELSACRFIVVMGGGNGETSGTSPNNLLSSSALSRVMEGVRVANALPEAKLIVTGPGGPGRETHASVLGRTAQTYGIAANRILFVDQARDSEEEAQAVQQFAHGGAIALVTSAWHMPRAMALFRDAGLKPVACPADFKSHTDDEFSVDDLFWEISALERSTLGVRERIGSLWIWLRGKG